MEFPFSEDIPSSTWPNENSIFGFPPSPVDEVSTGTLESFVRSGIVNAVTVFNTHHHHHQATTISDTHYSGMLLNSSENARLNAPYSDHRLGQQSDGQVGSARFLNYHSGVESSQGTSLLFQRQRASNEKCNVGQESISFGSGRLSACNYNIPHHNHQHHHHQVFAFSDTQRSNNPQSVESRLVWLPDGQASELQVRSNGYGQVFRSNDRASPLQVGHARLSVQANQGTSLMIPPQIAPNEYLNGGQEVTSGSNSGRTPNSYVPHHQHHQVISISESHRGGQGLIIPHSVHRFTRLHDGQVGESQFRPTGYGQTSLPNDRASLLQVAHAGHLNGHSIVQARGTSPMLRPQRAFKEASKEDHNGVQAFSSSSKGHEGNQQNSTKFQTPNQAELEQNARRGLPGNMEHRAKNICRFLVEVQHASKCQLGNGECKFPRCQETKLVLPHMAKCVKIKCPCRIRKKYIYHYNKCRRSCLTCRHIVAQLPKIAHFYLPFIQQQDKDTNLKRKRCNTTSQMISHEIVYVDLEIESISNTNTIGELSPSHKQRKADDTNQEHKVTSTYLNNGIELIILDEENSRNLPDVTGKEDRESVVSRVVSVKEAHGGTSFLYPPTSDQVTEINCDDQTEANAIADVDMAIESFRDSNTIDGLMPTNEGHKTEDPDQECQVIVLDEENSKDMSDEIGGKYGNCMDSGVVDINEGDGVHETISAQYEQEVEEKLLSSITLSSDAHVCSPTSSLYLASSDQPMKNSSMLNHCNDRNKLKEDINQGLEGSTDKNLGKLDWMEISSETARTEKIIEEKISVQCKQQVESQFHTKNDMVEVAVDSDKSMPSAALLNHTMLRATSASLIYSFTPEQVRKHILSLKPCIDQSKKTTDTEQRKNGSVDENCCTLCGLGELTVYLTHKSCSKCHKRIRKNANYYCKRYVDPINGDNAFICSGCYKLSPYDKLQKLKNSVNEVWVQCDKCDAWQHQICALFNAKMNEDSQAEYTCANCYLSDIKDREHKTLADGEILEAKHLPTTKLSDHLEQRLSQRLQEDRQRRAEKLGKNINEVPGAEDLIIREVSSVNKKVKVMDSLRERLLKDNFPTEFPYKSKAFLLFQKIGGVDVCLFAAYAQEYGVECPYPNRGCVYLSYIDSVNYFRPRIQAANEESLRTYVYHEILLGYLDYCKKRGFRSFQFWVCPQKKDDYILYSHPKEQKMLTLERLQKWYQVLICKAEEENIAVGSTNLYDRYFMSNGGEWKSNTVVQQLPYFDGDYWPIRADEILEEKNISKMKKKAKVQDSNVAREKLGGDIYLNKNAHMVVQLQHDYKDHKEFPLKEKYRGTTKNFNIQDIHLMNKDLVGMEEMAMKNVDEDENMSNRILNTRTDFLKFCQQNNYQFDTLRRAQHSTMMILYHLHNNATSGQSFLQKKNS